MALIYNSSIRNLFVEKILSGFSSPAVTLYSGEQPTPETFITSWSSYNNTNSNLLWHAASGLTLAINNGISIYASAFPALTAPVRNGTASWGVIWSGTVAYSAMGGAIPSTQFLIGHVTESSGSGLIRLQSTTCNTGTTMTLLNLGFTVSL